MKSGSLQSRLLAVVTLALAGAVILNAAILYGLEWRFSRQHASRTASAVARVVGANAVGALSFGDRKAASQILRGLVADSEVLLGCLYDREGTLFSDFQREGAASCPPSAREPAPESDRWLSIRTPVVFDGEVAGTVLLITDLSEARRRMLAYGGWLAAVLAFTGVIGLVLSARAHRWVTGPVLELARTARRVSESEDYSTRARQSGLAELTPLVEALNRLLEVVERSERSLREQSARLQATVKEQRLLEKERARLFLEEQLARADASFLAEASKVLASSMHLEPVLTALSRMLVSEFSDWALVGVRDGRWRCFTACPAPGAALEKIESWQPEPEAGEGVARALRTGDPVLHAGLAAGERVPLGSDDPEIQGELRALGLRSLLIAPMQVRKARLGFIALGTASRLTPYTRRDVPVAVELARRCSVAMENFLLYQEVQQAVKVREEFIAIASHELRTPITPLKTQVQLIQRHLRSIVPSADPRWGGLLRLLGGADAQLIRLTRLIDDLLEVSRIGAGKTELRIENSELVQLVRGVLERFAVELRKTGTEVSLEAETAIEGRWDPFRLEQVVVNLLTNAMKYGLGKPITIRLGKGEGEVFLEVIDRGIGIAPRDQERVFDRFERAVSFRTFSGFGLGLYITRQIVEAHGGRITVQSALGQGSTFRVELPRHAAAPPLEKVA